MKYDSHKSSIFDLDANIVALLVYLLPLLISIVNDSLSSIAWLIPLLAFLMENKSEFVVFHSANALAFYVIKAIVYVISSVLGITAVISSIFASLPLIGFIGVGISGIIFLIIGLITLAIEIYLFIGTIISLVKAYTYSEVNIPIIINITQIIQRMKR
ncbi:MAG: hypothetical protein ACI4U3_08980 [Traorella sp.]